MKKVFTIALSLVLIFSIAGLAAAADRAISHKISAELEAGYLALPGYDIDYESGNNSGNVYDNGAFFAQIRSLELRLLTDLDLSEQFSAYLVSQVEIFKDESDKVEYTTVASPILNYGLTYSPGPVKVMFDGKGQDIVMGIQGEELLKLNVARRYAMNSVDPDGDPKIYRYYDNVQAKQLTVEVPLRIGRVVSVFSLEPTPQGNAGAFVGGFGEVTLGAGKYSLGYQAKLTNDNLDPDYIGKPEYLYKNPVPAGFFVVAVDYHLSDRIRLQFDYSARDDGGDGYQPWFKPVSVLESYDQTPFLVKTHFNSKLNIDNYELALRLFNIDKYWLDASYRFNPYLVGINYRNWAFSKENDQAQADDYVAEIYGKRSLKANWQDYLKVFYRTDKSYGACVVVVFN